MLPAEAIAGSLGEGWTEGESGVLGEFHLVNYLLGDRQGYPWTAYGYEGRPLNFTEVHVQQAGDGWQGDAYRIFENDDERVLVVVVRFEVTAVDSGTSSRRRTAMPSRGARWRSRTHTRSSRGKTGSSSPAIEPVGRTVFFAIGTSAEVARAALAPLVGG